VTSNCALSLNLKSLLCPLNDCRCVYDYPAFVFMFVQLFMCVCVCFLTCGFTVVGYVFDCCVHSWLVLGFLTCVFTVFSWRCKLTGQGS